jgi:hypothetical protein
MEPSQAQAFLSQNPGLEGLIFTRFGQRYQTPGFVS